MSEGDDSVLRRQAQVYRTAADQYEAGAVLLRQQADAIEAREYKAEAPPSGWIGASSLGRDPFPEPEPEPDPELVYDPVSDKDEFALVAIRKAAANSIDMSDELYVGVLEDKGFTYDQTEEISEYFKEIVGAYKLEFDWGCSIWVDDDHHAHRTGFSYTEFKYGDDHDAMTVWWWEPPVTIRFDIDDMRRSVRQYATSYDDIKDKDDSYKEVRHELLRVLRLWGDCVRDLMVEIEDEL